MSAVPAPGYPVAQMGELVYREIYNQAAPTGRRSTWWFNWFAQINSVQAYRDWAAARRSRNSSDIVLSAAELLRAWGSRLAAAEETYPASQTQPTDIPYLALDTSSQQVSWGFTSRVGLPDSDWHRVFTSMFAWAANQAGRGTFSIRGIDIILATMVLPAAAVDRKFPRFDPPQALVRSPMAQEGWFLWRKESGGNEPFRIYRAASMEQWREQSDQFARLDSVLGGAERILRYASMQEPVLRLQERIQEFDRKRTTAADGYRVYLQNREIAQQVFTPAERAAIEADIAALREAEREGINSLPPGASGAVPSNLAGGLGAITFGLLLVAGTVAIGLIASFAYIIATIDTLIARQRAIGIQQRILEALEVERQEALRQREEALLAAQQVEDPVQRATLINQANQTYQRSVTTLTQRTAGVSSAAQGLAAAKPIAPEEGNAEQTWIAIAGGLGLLAWWGWRKRPTAAR